MPEQSRPSAASLQARLAIHTRHHPYDLQGLAELRRAHAAARVEEAVERLIAEAPPLSDEQRGRLAALLVGDGARVAGGAR